METQGREGNGKPIVEKRREDKPNRRTTHGRWAPHLLGCSLELFKRVPSRRCVDRADHSHTAVGLRSDLLAEEPDRRRVVSDSQIPHWEARGRARRDLDVSRVETALERVAWTSKRRLRNGMVPWSIRK